MLVWSLWKGQPGIEISNLEKWSWFDALGQAVLVYGMGGVPSGTEKKRGEKQESWVYWVMREHKYGMEPGPEHVRQVEQREFPLLTHGAFCSHHPSPQCSLSLFAALWCHPTPLTSFTACSRRRKRKTIWAVFFTKSAVVGWAIKYTQMNSGSDVFQTLNVSGAGARWSKW